MSNDLRELRAAVLARTDRRRRLHVLGVAQEIDTLALRWGADRGQAARAALLHDVTKGLTPAEQLKLCAKYDIVTQSWERTEHKLMHAVTGAAVARFEFGAEEAVCAAVRWHTTGRAGMTLLEKLLYLADYVDATRVFSEARALRALCYEDLDAALLRGLDLSIQFLLAERRAIHPDTMAARNALLTR
ncbi:MAG: bis(5'-nucleosyl)-tetraphosphatase (symmetrical) YqeK [Oscillospiraceae bacterium]|nr:bis(5'-nucleosyl)-tetraphosphatase (symmetrical) YqeK [Oscillospiraceae bacterium]